jgi:hypothetical protein
MRVNWQMVSEDWTRRWSLAPPAWRYIVQLHTALHNHKALIIAAKLYPYTPCAISQVPSI